MKAPELLDSVRRAISVGTAYGEPVEREGVTMVPTALVIGGGGAGGGDEPESGSTGGGGGFGVFALPLGAYEIRDGSVTWRPTGAVWLYGLIVVVPLLRALIRARN